jgi:hypothetical protein
MPIKMIHMGLVVLAAVVPVPSVKMFGTLENVPFCEPAAFKFDELAASRVFLIIGEP